MNCYEPIFGYFGEQFPVKQLRPGPVRVPVGNRFNLKNPACYLFPRENNCQPGDHFLISQKADAENFINYKPIKFDMPVLQYIANWISLLVVLLLIMLAVFQTTMLLLAQIRKID